MKRIILLSLSFISVSACSILDSIGPGDGLAKHTKCGPDTTYITAPTGDTLGYSIQTVKECKK